MNAGDAGASGTLLPQHVALIEASGITPAVAAARGYRSVTKKTDLARPGFASSQQLVPTLLIPVHGVRGEVVTCQHRPDIPRIVDGRPLKYETPRGSTMVLDVPPTARPWLGDPHRPLLITEGARKADSAVSRGLCCVALLGVWGWRGTNGFGGKTALADWDAIALNGRAVYLAFDSDVMTKRPVYAALVRLKTFLESRGAQVQVIYLPPGEGGGKVGLDDFLAAGGTVEELLQLATDTLRESSATDHEEGHGGPYRIEGGCICRVRRTEHGDLLEPLCNFTAQVREELILDDGAEETRVFLVDGRLETGEILQAARVPASRFGGMSWVTESWGIRAIVRAGLATKDALREAIQRLSPTASRRLVYVHTGWREIGGQWVYLTASGAIGMPGVEVELPEDLARYRLPAQADDPREAMQASLALLHIAPLRVTVPLWGAVFRAPLASALPVDVSVWVEGRTGSMKTTLAAVFLAHYGAFDRLHVPAGWASTANLLERRAFTLKDALFLIDDYVPAKAERRGELEEKAARVLRAQGNLTGRGRLRADLTERPTMTPRGLILATGEEHPPGESLLARLLRVELTCEDLDLARLTAAQDRAGRLPHALAGYLDWLAPAMPTIRPRLTEVFRATRALALQDGHLRVPEAIAHVWVGFDAGVGYAVEVGACSPQQADELRSAGWAELVELARAQALLVGDEHPAVQFLKTIHTLVTQRRVLLLGRDDPGDEVRREDCLIGWQGDVALLLLPEASYQAVARFYREAGEAFAVREDRLRRDLVHEGIVQPGADGRHTRVVKIAGRNRRVLWVDRARAQTLLGEAFPEPATAATAATGLWQ